MQKTIWAPPSNQDSVLFPYYVIQEPDPNLILPHILLNDFYTLTFIWVHWEKTKYAMILLRKMSLYDQIEKALDKARKPVRS